MMSQFPVSSFQFPVWTRPCSGWRLETGNRKQSAGFTLLEIILVVFLVAIIMSVFYGILVGQLNYAAALEEKVAATEVGPALLTQIRQDLESLVQPDTEKEYFTGSDRPGASGDRDRLDLVTAVAAFGPAEEDAEPAFQNINEVGYQVQDNPNEPGVGILCRRLDYFIDDEPLKGGRLIELYPRTLAFDLTYYDGKEWQREWETLKHEGKLPTAIKVDLKVRITDNKQDAERTYTTTITLGQ